MWEDRLRSFVPTPVRRNVFGPLGEIYPEAGLGAAGVSLQIDVSEPEPRSPIEGLLLRNFELPAGDEEPLAQRRRAAAA